MSNYVLVYGYYIMFNSLILYFDTMDGDEIGNEFTGMDKREFYYILYLDKAVLVLFVKSNGRVSSYLRLSWGILCKASVKLEID